MALVKRGRMKRLVLDIGTSAIRLCELSPTKAGYQLTRYYQRELHIDPSMDEETKLERKQEVLNALLKESKIRTKKTVMSVPGQSVFTRNRPLPPVPEYKVTQIVKYEIQQQIPFSLDQIALDYQILDRTEAGGYEVMMAAIKVDVVEKQLDVLKKTRRAIDIVDVAPLAVYNWLKHTGEFGDDGQCVAVIDMGATTTDIVIQKDNQFKFTRSLHVGGNDVTTAIASAFNQTFEDAERLKRERGFAPTGDPKRDGKGGEVIGRVLGRLVGEVNRSFSYFRSQPGGGAVNRVIVTGGGACLRNIIPYLQQQLGIEVRIAQPLAGLAVAPGASEASEHPEQACVVLGLALRCREAVPIEVNLIPPRVLELARRKEQAFYWALSLATLFLIMASIIPVTAAKVDLEEQRIRNLKRVLAEYDPALVNDPAIPSEFEDQFQIIEGDLEGYRKEVEFLDNSRENTRFWLEPFLEINASRPRQGGIVFTRVESAVFGGPGNTGNAARKAAAQGGAAAAGDQAGATAAAGSQDADASSADDGAEDSNGPAGTLADRLGGGFGGGLMSGGRAAGGPGAQAPRVTGFPGLGSRASSMTTGLGLGGATGNRRARNQAPATPQIVEPNGLVIFGYGTSIELVRDFVEALRQSPLFIKEGEDKGVYWDVAYSEEVFEGELREAKGTLPESRETSSRSSGGSSGESGIGAGLSSLSVATPSRPANRGPVAATGRTAVSFRIDVQFAGRPVPIPDKQAQGPARR